MTSRERVLTTLGHKEPDRVPISLGCAPSSMAPLAYRKLKKYLGIKEQGDEIVGKEVVIKFDERILQKFEVDFRCVYLNPLRNWKSKTYQDGTFTDEWGIRYKRMGDYLEIVDHPLKDAIVEDLQTYNWPNPHYPGRTDGVRKRAKELYETTDYAIDSYFTASIFEQSWYLRGFEKFLADLVINQKFAEALLDKVLEIQKGFFEEYLKAVGDYIHIVRVFDDLGMQTNLFINPSLYRKLIKPQHKELYRFIKQKTKAKLLHHSCGAIYPLIGDLIEIGLDILNSMQPKALGMGNPEKLKREFGETICFHGGVDIQEILPFGTPRQVKEEVKKRIRGFAPGGGYILATAHNIQADVPPRNVVAIFEAAREYGEYPLRV